jgi:hypothetical protein
MRRLHTGDPGDMVHPSFWSSPNLDHPNSSKFIWITKFGYLDENIWFFGSSKEPKNQIFGYSVIRMTRRTKFGYSDILRKLKNPDLAIYLEVRYHVWCRYDHSIIDQLMWRGANRSIKSNESSWNVWIHSLSSLSSQVEPFSFWCCTSQTKWRQWQEEMSQSACGRALPFSVLTSWPVSCALQYAPS